MAANPFPARQGFHRWTLFGPYFCLRRIPSDTRTQARQRLLRCKRCTSRSRVSPKCSWVRFRTKFARAHVPVTPCCPRSGRAAQAVEPARKDPSCPRPGFLPAPPAGTAGHQGVAANSTRAREPRRSDRSTYNRHEKWQSQGVTAADCPITSPLWPSEHTG